MSAMEVTGPASVHLGKGELFGDALKTNCFRIGQVVMDILQKVGSVLAMFGVYIFIGVVVCSLLIAPLSLLSFAVKGGIITASVAGLAFALHAATGAVLGMFLGLGDLCRRCR